MTDKITMMKLKDIHPYPGNPRRIGKDAVDAVARSIESFGWQQPIVVDREHTIIVGHTRYKAAQKLGLKEVPVLVADLDEQKAAEYRVADNRVAEFSTWDYGALLDELQTITGIDMADFGFAAVTADGGEGGGRAMTGTTSARQGPAPSSTSTTTAMRSFPSFVRIAASASRRGIDMDIVQVRPEDIHPYPNNPRVNQQTVEHLMRSIRDYGFRQPIVVDGDMVVIAGHARLKAALRLKLETVPVIIASGLTEEQARAYRLADNKTGDLTAWDDRALAASADLIGEAMAAYGMDFGEAVSKGSPERKHTHICPRCKHEF